MLRGPLLLTQELLPAQHASLSLLTQSRVSVASLVSSIFRAQFLGRLAVLRLQFSLYIFENIVNKALLWKYIFKQNTATYALFSRWLLLSLLPYCLRNQTPFFV